jgi:DNA repair protein RadA/Sms
LAKKKNIYVCVSCGAESGAWSGKCLQCGEWNSIVEAEKHAPKKESVVRAVSLSDVSCDDIVRLQSGYSEFDLACGGGIVKGAVTLIGGEPGIGKSTLSLQIADSFKTLYVSGEESPVQIRQRAERLNIKKDNILITTTTCVENIEELVEKHNPECVFVDSIQTVNSSMIAGPAGSIAQLRESALKLTAVAKNRNIPLFLIGHITKEGSIAGPKVLEHVVDTVLYFEGDFNKEYRILRSFKNRFGSVNEIGLFTMTDKGLEEVKDKNSVFFNSDCFGAPGIAVGSAIEGSRSILFEVQSLVSYSSFSNPRRTADGLDFNRLVIIAAALERYADLKLSNFDVFINLAGGFSINETASDLAVALSIASGYKNTALPDKTGYLGEISLAGEIRPVSQFERRLTEFERNNFTAVFVPLKNVKDKGSLKTSIKLIPVKSIQEALAKAF